MQSLACHACHARVFVAKYSPAHTSIQWTESAREACHAFAASNAIDSAPYVIRCEALDRTIDEAVVDGTIRATTRVEPAVTPLASEEIVTSTR